MKAILLIDEMPKNCEECPLHVSECLCEWCVLDAYDIEACPLKPLPNAITERGKWISEEYQRGWNAYRENLE